jgi:hypothetical protein
VIYKTAERLTIFLVLLAGISYPLQAQFLNYPEIFGNDWQKALNFIDENNYWIRPSLAKYNISYPEAIAVVFPELVRYSALRDKMEITLLKTLYRNLGVEYADFSVGVFQVKPSFAEKIYETIPGRKPVRLFKRRNEYGSDFAFRSAIISDLEDPKTELNYIIGFFKICETRFHIKWGDEVSKIKFLATAYNTGFWKSANEIEKMSEKKFFNTNLFKTENYSYADVSLYWYNQYIQNSKNPE